MPAAVLALCVVELIRSQRWISSRHAAFPTSGPEYVVQGISFEQWADKLNKEAEDYAKTTLNLTIILPKRKSNSRAQVDKGSNATLEPDIRGERRVRPTKKHPHRTIRKRKGGSTTTKSFYPRDWRVNPRTPKKFMTASTQEPAFDSSWDLSTPALSDDVGSQGESQRDETVRIATEVGAANSSIGAEATILHSLRQYFGGAQTNGGREALAETIAARKNRESGNAVLSIPAHDIVQGGGIERPTSVEPLRDPKKIPLRSNAIMSGGHHAPANFNSGVPEIVGRVVTSSMASSATVGNNRSNYARRRGFRAKPPPTARDITIPLEAKIPYESGDFAPWAPFEHGQVLTRAHAKQIVYTWADKRRVAHHVYISPENKLLITTIPKVACTEFMKLMIRMSGARNWRMDPHFRPKNPVLSRLKPPEASAILNDRSWTKAVFFRDPAERLLSAYLDKVR